jgi:hypothetical protein
VAAGGKLFQGGFELPAQRGDLVRICPSVTGNRRGCFPFRFQRCRVRRRTFRHHRAAQVSPRHPAAARQLPQKVDEPPWQASRAAGGRLDPATLATLLNARPHRLHQEFWTEPLKMDRLNTRNRVVAGEEQQMRLRSVDRDVQELAPAVFEIPGIGNGEERPAGEETSNPIVAVGKRQGHKSGQPRGSRQLPHHGRNAGTRHVAKSQRPQLGS